MSRAVSAVEVFIDERANGCTCDLAGWTRDVSDIANIASVAGVSNIVGEYPQ